jgi:preprotein translocase subunit SecF
MEFFKIRRDIPFMKNALIFNVISFLTFAGGVLPVHARAAPVGGVHRRHRDGGELFAAGRRGKGARHRGGLGYTDVQVQNFGTARDVMIRLPAQKGVSSAQQSDKVLAGAQAANPT